MSSSPFSPYTLHWPAEKMKNSTPSEDEGYASFFDSIFNEEAFLSKESDDEPLSKFPSSMATSYSEATFSTPFLPLTPPLTSTPPFSPAHSIFSSPSHSPSPSSSSSSSSSSPSSTILSSPLYTSLLHFSSSKPHEPASDLFSSLASSSMSPLEFNFSPSGVFSTDLDVANIASTPFFSSFSSSSSLPSPPLTLSSLLLPSDRPLENEHTATAEVLPNTNGEPKRKRLKRSSSLPSESVCEKDTSDVSSTSSTIAASPSSTLQRKRGNFSKQNELEKILKTELEVELPKNIPKSKFPPELKKQIRMIKNRLAASESRQRAKDQLKHYQQLTSDLAQENKRLHDALARCEQEKETLQKTLQEFSASLDLLHTAHVAPLLGPRTSLRSFGALVVCLVCVLLWLPSSLISSALYPGLDPTVPNGVYSTDVAPWNARELELALAMRLRDLPASQHNRHSPLALPPPSASSVHEGRQMRLAVEQAYPF